MGWRTIPVQVRSDFHTNVFSLKCSLSISSLAYFFPIGQHVGAHDGAQTGIGGGGGGGGRKTGGGGGVQHCCGQILIQ